MKRISWYLTLLLVVPIAWAGSPQAIDVEIEGMACPFCAHAVEVNLGKLPSVAKVVVNLEAGRALVIAKPGEEVDIGRVKKVILDAGFTPGEAKVNTQQK